MKIAHIQNGDIVGAEIVIKFDSGQTMHVDLADIAPGAGFVWNHASGAFQFCGHARHPTYKPEQPSAGNDNGRADVR